MLKRYYQLREAVEFLSSERGQQVSVMDVREMAMRGEIRFCTFFSGVIAKFERIAFDDAIPQSLPFSFRGYIQMPKRFISPAGGPVYLGEIVIVEVVDSDDSDQPTEAIWPQHYESYTCIPETGAVVPVEVQTNCDDAVIPAADLLSLPPWKAKENRLWSGADRYQLSANLVKVNQAAVKFWANADRDDKSTHPKNSAVIAWLVQQGLSQTLADKAATIIRPDWASTGRKPEE